MSGEIMIGKCMYCMRMSNLERTYFHFNIKCECHSPNHFESVEHCVACKPKMPSFTSILLKKNFVEKSFFEDHQGNKVYLKDFKEDITGKHPTLSDEIRIWIPTTFIEVGSL